MAWGRATVAQAILLILQHLCEATVIIPITPNSFESFISTNHVRLIHVSYKASAHKIQSFLAHYCKAAAQLETYGILLGQVACDEFPTFEYCTRERTERFLFGFRGTRERLVLPLSTLADENAIVASALHLALINSVPIIQTSSELRALERKCSGKCNVVLAYHNTLGTLEHSLFLQLAWAHRQHHVFALTTSIHASPGAPLQALSPVAPQLVALWLLQCKDSPQCEASLFRNNFSFDEVNKFVKGLELPQWIEMKGQHFPGTYERFGTHQVVLVFDHGSRRRVLDLARPLGLAFRGSAGVVLCPLAKVARTPLRGSAAKIVAPALVFLPATTHVEPRILNELENAYDFVLEQLKYEELFEISKENNYQEYRNNHLLKYSLLDSREDSEISKQLLQYDKLTVPSIGHLDSVCLPKVPYRIILYYLDWNAVSQMMLKMFESLDLSHMGVELMTISCFSSSDRCDNIPHYPTIEMVGPSKSQRFGAMSNERMLEEIYLFVSPNSKTFWSEKLVQEELRHDEYKHVTAVALLAVDRENDSNHIADIVRANLPRKIVLLVGFSEAANYIANELQCSVPCLGVKRLRDNLEPTSTYHGGLEDHKSVRSFLETSLLPIMPQLTPELLPEIRDKLLIVALGFQPSTALLEIAHDSKLVHFCWIPRHAPWFEQMRRTHAPSQDSTLVALDLRASCSYQYPGKHHDKKQVESWINNIFNRSIVPSVYLHDSNWKPLRPAVDYLKLLEEERFKVDQTIIMDTEDPFVSPQFTGIDV